MRRSLPRPGWPKGRSGRRWPVHGAGSWKHSGRWTPRRDTVQHAEEGTLHSYLDGELTPAEVIELERHLSVCAPCRAKLTEAKSFLGLADELIPLLDTVPAGTKAPATAPKPRRGWPVRPAVLAWAASVVLAGGVGYAWHAQQVTVAPAEALRQLSDASSNTAPATSQPVQPI